MNKKNRAFNILFVSLVMTIMFSCENEENVTIENANSSEEPLVRESILLNEINSKEGYLLQLKTAPETLGYKRFIQSSEFKLSEQQMAKDGKITLTGKDIYRHLINEGYNVYLKEVKGMEIMYIDNTKSNQKSTSAQSSEPPPYNVYVDFGASIMSNSILPNLTIPVYIDDSASVFSINGDASVLVSTCGNHFVSRALVGSATQLEVSLGFVCSSIGSPRSTFVTGVEAFLEAFGPDLDTAISVDPAGSITYITIN